MLIGDDDQAIYYLRHLNDYRLSAYWLPFEKDHTQYQFHKGTSFKNVLNLYIFDRELRLWLMDAIERVEVSLRTQLAYHLSLKHGSHPHLKQSLFHDKNRFEKLNHRLSIEVKQSGEDFIRHLVRKYSDSLPPIWALVELISLGQLSQFYGNLKNRQDRKEIADVYDIDEKCLRSFLHHLTTVRNFCAHHSRVWNRDFTVTLKIPTTRPRALIHSFNCQGKNIRKIYNTLVLLAFFMDTISPDHHWKQRLIDLLNKHEIEPHAMGFPDQWQQMPICSVVNKGNP